MARGVNKVILIGNLGADPEIRYTQNNQAFASLSVATSESWKDKQSGEQQEKTEWHRCVAWRRLAEICGEYLSKGSKVYIEGSLQTRKWQDQQGNDRWTTEIVVRDMQMLDSRGGGQQRSDQPPADDWGGGQQRSTRSRSGGGSAKHTVPPGDQDNFNDDIPF